MRSRSRTVRLPFIVDDVLQQMCKESGYTDMSNCILGACIILIQNKRRETWVREVANAKPKLQDFLLEKMLSFPLHVPDMIEALKTLPAKRYAHKRLARKALR